jgi:hypothetical protein
VAVSPEGDAVHVVHEDRHRRLTATELGEPSAKLDDLHGTQGSRHGTGDCRLQDVHPRKFAAGHAAETDRSVRWWLECWNSGDSSTA